MRRIHGTHNDDGHRCDFRRRATEGVADWLAGLSGGVAAHLPAGMPSPPDARIDAERMRALVRDRVTTNPVTRAPLAPVQIHLLELVLDAVDWPALAAVGHGRTPHPPGASRGGPS